MYDNDETELRTDGSYVFDEDDIEANRVWAIIAYFCWLIALLVKKDSHFVRFHANQALLTWLVMLICGVIMGVVPIFGWILGAILGIWLGFIPWISCLAMAIKGGVKRANYYGQFNIIPL